MELRQAHDAEAYTLANGETNRVDFPEAGGKVILWDSLGVTRGRFTHLVSLSIFQAKAFLVRASLAAGDPRVCSVACCLRLCSEARILKQR